MKTIVTVILALSFVVFVGFVSSKGCDSACTNHDATRDTLDNAGYSEIEPGDYAWFECGEDDFYHTEFRAINPKGKQVEGVVCCGLWAKGCTIRF